MKTNNDKHSFKSLATPVYRGSTIVFEDFQSFEERKKRQPDGFSYGITGSPTHREVEKLISGLEGSRNTVVLPSGQAALVLVLMSTLKGGDHIIAPDSCYGPLREFLTDYLAQLNVEVTFCPPRDTAFIQNALCDNTRLILIESPCSLTMEIQDIEKIAMLARQHNILTVVDNSWGGPLLSRPFRFGVDYVVEAVSKMMNGHSDILLGSISTVDNEHHARLRKLQDIMGMYVSPDDCFLAIRGLETYSLRQEKQSSSAEIISHWLEKHPAVAAVFHPGLASSEDNRLYKKYFDGYGTVFSLTLKDERRLERFFDSLTQFRIGASYGGTKSLIAYYSPESLSSRRYHDSTASIIRLSVGLEDCQLLINDLDSALNKII